MSSSPHFNNSPALLWLWELNLDLLSDLKFRGPQCLEDVGQMLSGEMHLNPRPCGIFTVSGSVQLSHVQLFQFSSVQSLSHIRLIATPWIAAHQASLSITNSRSSLKLMSIESMMPSSHRILCCPLLLSIFPSIRVFADESALCIKWPKYWSFSFSISPSNEYPGLISFRRHWFDLLAVQGTLKSLLKHHNSKL